MNNTVELPEQWKDAEWVSQSLYLFFADDLEILKQYWFTEWNFETGDPVAHKLYLKLCEMESFKPPANSVAFKEEYGDHTPIKFHTPHGTNE